MKRKKQMAESANRHNAERSIKRTRSADSSKADIQEDDEQAGADSGSSKRKSLRRRRDSKENGPSEVPPDVSACENDEVENSEEEANDELAEGEDEAAAPIDVATPKKQTNGYLSESAKKAQVNGITPIKASRGKKLFSTPVKANGTADDTPKLERHIDRSARRKSTRNLIERTVLGHTSDNDEGEEDIEEHIYASGEEKDEEEEDDDAAQYGLGMSGEAQDSAPETPSRRRGRPKKTRDKELSPPPTDLPPHELYFSQNRGGRNKTSNNNLNSLQLLDHEEYFTILRNFQDPHADDIEWLMDLHEGSFNQWQFELSQNFNLCLFGWGSKRSLIMKFAEHIYKSHSDHLSNKIVVVNGYVQTLTIRDILNTIGAAVSEPAPKLGSQPADMLENLLLLLEEDSSLLITVIIHSIDRAPLRRPTTQTLLSRLSSHPQIHLVASADHPSFPLLWDSSLWSTYNFLFHDCTTFQPYSSEIDVVDEVHELLGRSGRRVGGKEGVSFVLKSLPENAKNLFRVLIGEQLAAMDDNAGTAFGGDDDEDDDNETRNGSGRRNEVGVEYRVLYQKAVEEFICSNEMNFRTLLKE